MNALYAGSGEPPPEQRWKFAVDPAGDRDAVVDIWGEEVDAMERYVSHLTKKVILPSVGHWTQQESPAEVNRLLIEFLRSLK